MNPLASLGVMFATMVGVWWLGRGKSASSLPGNVVRPATSASSNPTPLVIPFGIPSQIAPSPAAQNTANARRNSIAPPATSDAGDASSVMDSTLPYQLSYNVPTYRSIPKEAQRMLMDAADKANRQAAGKGGCGGCGGGCDSCSAVTGKCSPGSTIDTHYSDGASCMASTRGIQQANTNACDPMMMAKWEANMRGSQGGLLGQGPARGNGIGKTQELQVNPGSIRSFADTLSLFAGSKDLLDNYGNIAQSIMDSETGYISAGADPAAAFRGAVESLDALQAYSQVFNWNNLTGQPVNPNSPFISVPMAQQAIANGTGVTGIDPNIAWMYGG